MVNHKFAPPKLLTSVQATAAATDFGFGERALAPFVAPTFPEVFEAQSAFVWKVAARLGTREADLPDVCQEIFVVVHRMLPTFEGRCSLTTWLYSICLRVVSTHRRKVQRRRETPSDELPETSMPSQQIAYLEAREFRDRLDAVLDSLPREQRDIFVLYELEELSVPEAAAVLGCPVQTAYSRLHAARRAVLASFGSDEGGAA
jgi:RNA polymerase sigma-70 factor (ECF subfamily)